MLVGAVVRGGDAGGRGDPGLALGVEVMGRVVVAAGTLVMAYDGGLGIVRVPEVQGVGGEPLGVEMPRVVGHYARTAPSSPNLNTFLSSITEVYDQKPHMQKKRLISILRFIQLIWRLRPWVLYAFTWVLPKATIGPYRGRRKTRPNLLTPGRDDTGSPTSKYSGVPDMFTVFDSVPEQRRDE